MAGVGMSLNTLGPKKTKQWARRLGLPIERINVHSDHESGRWLKARLEGYSHIVIDKKTSTWTEEENVLHWSSCRTDYPQDFD